MNSTIITYHRPHKQIKFKFKQKCNNFRSSRHYSESTYRDTARETRDRSDRSRSRGTGGGGGGSGATDHYNREERLKFSNLPNSGIKLENIYSASSRSARPRKSPETANEPANETSKRNYYDERYGTSRDRDRDRSDRDRSDRDGRDRDHRSRH